MIRARVLVARGPAGQIGPLCHSLPDPACCSLGGARTALGCIARINRRSDISEEAACSCLQSALSGQAGMPRPPSQKRELHRHGTAQGSSREELVQALQAPYPQFCEALGGLFPL